MFHINDNKGFSITFDNGYTVSVQFGPGNYCSNRNIDPMSRDYANNDGLDATTAETALLDPHGNFIAYKDDDVQGYQTVNDVMALLNYAAAQR
jgi:hypothetical protein